MTRGRWEAMVVIACGVGVTIAAGLNIAVTEAYLDWILNGLTRR